MNKLTISKLKDSNKAILESDDPLFLSFEIDGKISAQTCTIRALKMALNAFYDGVYDHATGKIIPRKPLQSST